MGRLVLNASVVAVMTVASVASGAQSPEPPKPATARVELTGCVSLSPGSSGQFAFVDAGSGGTYRLSGRSVKKYAGQRVTLVGDPSTKRLRVRLGLWPSPNVAAQAGALDPAQESIARQAGGAANVPDTAVPELKVVRVQGAEGSCR